MWPRTSAPASWPKSTWASASTATGPCTNCAPRPWMCSGRRWTASARDGIMTEPETIVVSNRGPLSFRFDAEQNLQPLAGGGGLVSALRPLLAGAETDAMWFSMTMGPADEAAVAAGRMLDPALALRSVTVDPGTYRMAYDVIANTTLWYI